MSHCCGDVRGENTDRDQQIRRLLEAIGSYCPTSEELQSMESAKRDMQKNIQKKFNQCQANFLYRFPFVGRDQEQVDDDGDEECADLVGGNVYALKGQNRIQNKGKNKVDQESKSSEMALREKSNNKPPRYPINDMGQKPNHKHDECQASLVANIHKAIKSGMKCQTPKVIKKEIILTNKKHHLEKENMKTTYKHNDSHEKSIIGCDPTVQSTGVRAKLKIKKPNASLNETSKKNVQLRTQNNVNFKPYFDCSVLKRNGDCSQFQQTLPQPIFEQPSLEDSVFNNSKVNCNLDENVCFGDPSKGMFNVYELKEKLRETSQSCKKEGLRRHKRTATEGDCSVVKIKLFSSSFRKEEGVREDNKHNTSTQMFLKKPYEVGSSRDMNIESAVKSSLSQHSLKKGIRVCGRAKVQLQKSSQQKSELKCSYSRSTQKLAVTDNSQHQSQLPPKYGQEVKNYTIMLRPGEGKRREKTTKQVSGEKLNIKKECNFETGRVSKINSIMNSLKEEYRNKNTNKSTKGIKATVCV